MPCLPHLRQCNSLTMGRAHKGGVFPGKPSQNGKAIPEYASTLENNERMSNRRTTGDHCRVPEDMLSQGLA